ncbi:hypothetical protein FisN_4Hh544 [Fistulifera solaris]|uniref:SGF29 C-terminal domain-containing protein n=1 Tax=Fistulifera solaris TaxID=1519565 RepID=A0A1Z5KIQ1_FISSO|nr:hypothetical protein FisN_4Hh544 [Fistulifera solaris]|eukprot:GAX25972.1 hypothetical protein FisN_4Hh544 [Fistulifera solaris]
MTAFPSASGHIQQQQQFQMQQGYNQMQMQQQMRIQNQMQPPQMQNVSTSLPNSAINYSINTNNNQVPNNMSAPLPSQAAKPVKGSTAALPGKSVGPSKATSHTVSTPTPALPIEEVRKLLNDCDWVDKTMWAARQIFGGQALNGFLRSTATVQRVKKQRARQTASTRAKQPDEQATDEASGKRDADAISLTAEENLKKEIMNARTAKKLKTELESGLEFCEFMHETIRNIISDINPLFVPPPPLGKELPDLRNGKMLAVGVAPTMPLSMSHNMAVSGQMSASTIHSNGQQLPPSSPMQSKAANAPRTNEVPPSYPHGSSLRKLRKKKLPPNSEPAPKLSEFDETGKKRYPKKELLHRVSHILRYRALREGDLVAARPTSRELWILAKVLRNYPGFPMSPDDFLSLSESKKDNLFREKVLIKDVEQKNDGSSVMVDRKLVLPLPRNFSEAADWGQRVKKGSRVYAMYPQTTSLYPATVVDNSTYCRDDDDIIVVEFDGDEPDSTGMIPKCHIPARFVTIIPREFAASNPPSATNKKKGGHNDAPHSTVVQSAAAAMLDSDAFGNLDDLTFDDALPALDGFDDLDFDLFGG